MKNIILASKSPRRKGLLEKAGFKFSIKTIDVDETFYPFLSNEINSLIVARKKADILPQPDENTIVISADTIVILGDKVYGKPKDKDDAIRMLKELSGKTHHVMTSVCLLCGRITKTFSVVSDVIFKDLSEEDIEKYILSEEWKDKAGAYAIQGIGKKLVSGYTGSFTNIVGLPIEDIENKLKKQL